MHTLFLGNLPYSMTEAGLRELFRRTKIEVISIDVRRGGVAFAYCPDQNSADRAIEVLNGYRFSGVPIRVEPSMPKNFRSPKLFLRQLPLDVDWKEIDAMIAGFGEVLHCERGGTNDSSSIIVTYKTNDEAEAAVENLDKRDYRPGRPMKATIYHDRNRNMRRSGGSAGGGMGMPGMGVRPPPLGMGPDRSGQGSKNGTEMPLRMVVDASLVGAIIGKEGSNIRQITKESKARCVVDVSRGTRDPAGNIEKVVNVYGTPECTTMACSKILELIQRESPEKEPTEEGNEGATGELELKLRVHNNLVGRLIGKAGSTIKKIMEETGCTVFVSNIGELSAFDMERTITIRGSLENIAKAESKISEKLRQCWQSDMTSMPSGMYNGGVHPLMAPTPIAGPMAYQFGGYPPLQQQTFVPGAQAPPGIGRRPMSITPIHGTPSSAIPIDTIRNHPRGNRGPNFPQVPVVDTTPSSQLEIAHLWVPNGIVGALIGAKGVHIRNVIRMTGATIRIESAKTENDSGVVVGEGSPQSHPSAVSGQRESEGERRVTIMGNEQQQYKAQFWVYQRVCEQGYRFFDEVRLCTEVQVPSKLVGRIIGKAGQNVRELQRVTGAQVQVPDDAESEDPENAMVQIIGNFNASHAVQSRISQLVCQFNQQLGRSDIGQRHRSSNSESHE